jgi:hypothetical protein
MCLQRGKQCDHTFFFNSFPLLDQSFVCSVLVASFVLDLISLSSCCKHASTCIEFTEAVSDCDRNLWYFLYHVSNNAITNIIMLFAGNFSGNKAQEIVVAKSNSIELLRPDDTGKLISICETPVFAIVRSLLPFRLAGMHCQEDK